VLSPGLMEITTAVHGRVMCFTATEHSHGTADAMLDRCAFSFTALAWIAVHLQVLRASCVQELLFMIMTSCDRKFCNFDNVALF
jgi:hypothetical protein